MTTSVYSEKTRLKKLMMIMIFIIIIMNKSQEMMVAPEIDFCYETEARKMMVDFKFDVLHR